jgi:hypothetical protein
MFPRGFGYGHVLGYHGMVHGRGWAAKGSSLLLWHADVLCIFEGGLREARGSHETGDGWECPISRLIVDDHHCMVKNR